MIQIIKRTNQLGNGVVQIYRVYKKEMTILKCLENRNFFKMSDRFMISCMNNCSGDKINNGVVNESFVHEKH